MPIDPETKKILYNRLANGEIDKEKYRELLAELSGNDPVEEPKTPDPGGLSSDPAIPTIDAPDPMMHQSKKTQDTQSGAGFFEEAVSRIENQCVWAGLIAFSS